MTPAETLTLAAYFFVLIILAIYGWHRYYLVYLYLLSGSNQLFLDDIYCYCYSKNRKVYTRRRH